MAGNRSTLGSPPASEPHLEFTIMTPRTEASAPSYWDGDVDTEVQAAAAGDQRAVTRLLTHLQPLVTQYCRTRVRARDCSLFDPEVIAQEINIGVLKALPRLRGRNTPFLLFVYGIAAHKLSDALRAARRDQLELTANTPDIERSPEEPEPLVLRAEVTAHLGKLLRRLHPRQRKILALRVVLGLSSEETAQAIGSTPGAVRVAQHRALAKLRAVLAADRSVLP
ncbi:sigma-70 family RNA polymerase sigma factor [Lentzea sp. NPDC004782]|uniref:sigma-70 family RNA polymerase sigma factor n=1 Tax=Lentzea sp. NPDC004782 TaxID=3154458 RepID=UPI0033BAC7F5